MRSLKYISILIIYISFVSCKKDDGNSTAKPVISDLEVGIGEGDDSNSHIGYVGTDLHVEAKVVAEAKIKSIQIEIHSEENEEQNWKYNEPYSVEEGLKNTTVHTHIDIPADTKPGDYHFHLVVIDLEGNSTEVSAELEIKAAE